MVLAAASVPPPGANPTSSLIGLVGKFATVFACANAALETPKIAPIKKECVNIFLHEVMNIGVPQKTVCLRADGFIIL
jgi:hypothetical protein